MNEHGVNFIGTIIRINVKFKEQALRTKYNGSGTVPGSRKASENKILYYLIYPTYVICINFKLFELQAFRKMYPRIVTLFRVTIL